MSDVSKPQRQDDSVNPYAVTAHAVGVTRDLVPQKDLKHSTPWQVCRNTVRCVVVCGGLFAFGMCFYISGLRAIPREPLAFAFMAIVAITMGLAAPLISSVFVVPLAYACICPFGAKQSEFWNGLKVRLFASFCGFWNGWVWFFAFAPTASYSHSALLGFIPGIFAAIVAPFLIHSTAQRAELQFQVANRST